MRPATNHSHNRRRKATFFGMRAVNPTTSISRTAFARKPILRTLGDLRVHPPRIPSPRRCRACMFQMIRVQAGKGNPAAITNAKRNLHTAHQRKQQQIRRLSGYAHKRRERQTAIPCTRVHDYSKDGSQSLTALFTELPRETALQVGRLLRPFRQCSVSGRAVFCADRCGCSYRISKCLRLLRGSPCEIIRETPCFCWESVC